MSIEMNRKVIEKVLGGFCENPDAWSETDEDRYYLYSSRGEGTPHVIRGIAYEYERDMRDGARRYARKWTRFSPSESIADAWVVVDAVAREHRLLLCLHDNRGWYGQDERWQAKFHRPGDEVGGYVDGTTPALAICAAALAAVEKETVA